MGKFEKAYAYGYFYLVISFWGLIFFSSCDRIYGGEFETFLTEPTGEKTKLKERKMKKGQKRTALYITRGALVAAMYVALTYLTSLFGIDKGAIQFRLSEALCILPALMPEAIPGLYVGCLIANIVTACAPWDVALGSLATLIGAVGAHLLGRLPKKLSFLIPIPTVIANAVIVPFVIIYAYGATDAYAFILATVTLGEVVCAFALGLMLYHSLKNRRIFKL